MATENPIKNVRVINLHFEYPDGAGYPSSRGSATGGLVSLVEVTLENGVQGLGPVYSHPDLLRIVVEQHLAPFLVGRDPSDTDACWTMMHDLTKWYGRRGIALSALGGVDSALWDIRGKLADKRVSELLGGTRTSIPAYASDLLWEHDLSRLTEKTRGFVDDGFRFVKMRTGLNPEYDRAAVAAVMEGAGEDAQVLVDGASRYTVEEARELATFLAEQGAYFFEEPIPADDLDGYIELTRDSPLPIAAGEHETSFAGFRELLRAGAINIVQPDVSRCGGVTEVRRIAQLADEHGAPVITHTWSDAATVVANAQVVTAVPNGVMVEINRTESPFIDELLAEPLVLDANGHLALPDAAGLGIVLAEDALERFAVDPSRPAPEGHYSDLTFGGQFAWTWGPYPTPEPLERPSRLHA
jgi:L-alanine-DL-glutamate epimerase-like enolase superfamily enzyme